jgi:hypothetical protein
VGNLREPFIANEALAAGIPDLRAPLVIIEPLAGGTPDLRSPLVVVEPLTEGTPKLRQDLVTIEGLTEGYRNLRQSLLVIETLQPVGPEEFMTTTPFPGFGNSDINPSIPAAADPAATKLPGLAFSVHKKPTFKTRVAEATSGVEARNALMQYPRWAFTLTYEFLEDSSGWESSLKTILGFYLSMQGPFRSWLFKDPDDYIADNHFCGVADGTITEFPASRVMGGFRERVGQIDLANSTAVYNTVLENRTIPVTPGPYTLTANYTTFQEDLGVTKGGIPMTRVASAPAAGQYAVDELTGIYTFNSADNNQAVILNYRYLVNPADYTLTMPNRIIFSSAPPAGDISWSGQFFFVCRFLEDEQDYEKFADKLWSLDTCEFRSVIQ